MQIVAVDQVIGARTSSQIIIDWREDIPVTLRFLIEERVRLEWENRETVSNGFAEPVSNELAVAGASDGFYASPIVGRNGRPCPQTCDEAIAEAFQAFDTNGFFVIVDGRQMTELDSELRLGPKSEIRFLRLIPLVGG